jgi:hypothetical protein
MDPAIAVIILNWKRPQNIGRIVETASEALPHAQIFVVDQAEDPDSLIERTDVPRERCWIRTQPNAGPGVRIKLAAQMPFDHILCLDDDIFLTVDQIRILMARLAADPDSVHGLIGQLFRRYRTGLQRIRLRADSEASFLNCVYAFTRTRAIATMRLARSTGYARWEDVARTEDILLSAAGPGPARVHYLGPLDRCETSSAQGVALVSSAGFREERHTLIVELAKRGVLYLAS